VVNGRSIGSIRRVRTNPEGKGQGRHRAAPFGLGPWDGARVMSPLSPILRPGHLRSKRLRLTLARIRRDQPAPRLARRAFSLPSRAVSSLRSRSANIVVSPPVRFVAGVR